MNSQPSAEGRADFARAGAAIEPALLLENVVCTFPSRENPNGTYCAVSDTTISIAEGEFVSIVGPTGCGKSTLLNVASGLLDATSGRVECRGAPVAGINRHAGYMFQSDALMPWRTALENVVAGLEFAGVAKREAEDRGRAWMARVGLSGFEHSYPHHMSGGMRKRVALAQMLILDPAIIMMDEPFSALDVQTRQLMENELLDLWSADRKSVMFITHDLEEAIALSDRVICLSAGPGTHPIGEFVVNLPRPRNVAEISHSPEFQRIQREIWEVLRQEVLKGYAQNKK
ncbi:ABC transporter ATP-binding protein [Aurantimonas endophytica]|uniref:NitT/TauT family transport system ATP-binding protein n=1 Tax=Aurantimonas endophytica TaxID=1522175 RepID=A0A7W6HCL6_9HYPH|nr:ABC transporter ATP-binding protein [Aurantimonas endophytica]MBB4002577.1 NitT/TauT family transport system ATP-binding protein [Aurantimonas endophytica]MCO6403458.1 ATP-binding cassette domain-containing protein [Aurantimonas endophytica]